MMTSQADHSQLGLAVRRQRGRTLAPAVLRALGEVLGPASLGFLPLEETDRRFESYSRAFQACLAGEQPHMHARVQQTESAALFSRLGLLAKETPPYARVVLFGRDWELTGAIEVPAAQAWAAAEDLLRLEVDELRGMPPDGCDGFLIDRLERENEIEFWCWGTTLADRYAATIPGAAP
jgi:hypothetical protein